MGARSHWLIDQCVLVGDRRPYITALITVDPDAFAEWKREHDLPGEATVAEPRSHPALLAAVQAAVDEVNRSVSHAEAIRRFHIVAARFLIGEELTPTQKVRRDYVLEKFADAVEALYDDPA